MKLLYSTLLILILFFSANLLALEEDSTQAVPDTIAWYTDYDQAVQDASKDGRYLLMDFYTDWWSWCKRLDSATFRDPLIATMSKSFVFYKTNADENRIIAKKYGVSGFPTMVITKANGVEIDRLVGYYPPEEFVPAMFDLMMNRNTLDDLLSKAIIHNDSLELLFDIAQSYTYKSDKSNAEYYYTTIMERDAENEKGLNADCWFELASLKRKDKDVEGAIAMYEEFEGKFPESDMIELSKLMIPYTYHKADELKAAEKNYKKFKKAYPESERLEWIDKQLEKIKEEKKNKK